MDFEAAGTKRKMQLSELEEWREKAYHSAKIYKERIKGGNEKDGAEVLAGVKVRILREE